MHELSEVYKPTITRNKEKLIELIKEKAEHASKSELARKMKVLKGFYTLEMAPPMEMQKLTQDLKLAQEFFKTGAVMHLTVKQAWLLFLVGLEVSLWFYIGETIGKGRIVGYVV
ncbi:ATP synthase F(0) complex subunit g, mitochondrial-like isoform X2 [Anticarsia gemmatalis]|uniref:ATP synthase F(0) complex subunit g, mitochondrial-like isoform X2 n=2 Tax=Anticarsia gemmatalis TaxID=129554 RepID=UPI003F76D040